MNIDLLLVNPGNRLEQFATLNELATVAQPLGIALIASYVREHGFSVAIIDAEAEFWTPEQTIHEIEKYNPLLIGLTAFTPKMTSAGKILKLIRERMPHVKTVLGGHHASAIPERTLREESVDFVVRGEGFRPIVELLERLKSGWNSFKYKYDIPGVWYLRDDKVVDNGRALGVTLDNLPSPAWDLLPMEKYRAHHWQSWGRDLDFSRFAVIYTSLGCPFDCDYCSVNVVYGNHNTRYRKIENVVREMELLVSKYKVKTLELIDDTFTLNSERAGKLCDEIISHGLGDKLNMWCFARTDRVNPYLMEKMKKAGINWVFMGFESGVDSTLKGVHKNQTVGLIKKATEIVHNAGINVGGNYVFGLPGDTQETMQQTFDLAKELNTEYANFFVTMAYPGTKLYEKANKCDLPEKWGQYGFFAPDALPLRTETLIPEEILRFRDNAFKEYFNGERYQNMIRNKFGEGTLDFLRNKVLSKDIVRC